MHRIAVIGAGQLGSRHLQGLARLGLQSEIHVVDPSPDSLKLAAQRFGEMPANASVGAVRYHARIDALPRELEYAIIATSSDVRLAVLEGLLAHSSVRYLMLEKVLFQRVADYARAGEILANHQVRAWVNCPRRTFRIYIQAREFFPAGSLRYFQVRGGDWGLGCNCIHYFDTLGMLTGLVPAEISTEALDKELIPSKRRGFMEFTGTLRGRFGADAEFEITSIPQSSSRTLVTLRSERRACVIDEIAGCAFFLDEDDGGAWRRTEFHVPFVSEQGAIFASGILTDGTCPLPSFEDSVGYHLPIIKALGAHAARYHGGAPEFCPIT